VPLSDGDLLLRPYRPADEQALQTIVREPEVSRWWPDPTFVRERGWTIEIAGEPAGWLEYHEESYAWYPSVAFDIFLGAGVHGRVYGRRALRLALAHFVARGHHRFTVDPNAANERAIRSYEAVGFERVGVMRAYERDPAGGWNDGLLMELIVPEAMERALLSPAQTRA
jgi:aminoglycoside 6'-N-acetyltransferase